MNCDKFLSEIEERCKAASPGPWVAQLRRKIGNVWASVDDGKAITGLGGSCSVSIENASLIAHSRTDIETLVKMVRCARGAFRIALWEFNDRTQGNSEAFAKMEIAICNGLAELDRLAGEGKC